MSWITCILNHFGTFNFYGRLHFSEDDAPTSHALLQNDLLLLYRQVVCPPSPKSGWVFDGFGQQSMVGVMLLATTGDAAPALFAGPLAFWTSDCSAARKPNHMEWPRVGALVTNSTSSPRCQKRDEATPTGLQPQSLNHPQLLSKPSWPRSQMPRSRINASLLCFMQTADPQTPRAY